MFSYYSNVDGRQFTGATKQAAHKHIFLAQLYCITNEIAENDEDRSRMKAAIQELNDKQSGQQGCISLQDFLHIVDQGRTTPVDIHNFHFIRIIAEYERRSEYDGEYLLAKEFLDHCKLLQKEEEHRQLADIKNRQTKDKRKIVTAHANQLVEFKQQWDVFMSEFETRSQTYLDELNQTHQDQLAALHSEVMKEVKTKPQRWSKELVDWRKREAIMADQQKYQEAQKIKAVSDKLEAKERATKTSNLESSLKLKEGNLKKQHAAEKAALQQRIDTKRKEFQCKHKADHARMLQRNKNIIAMLDSKHVSLHTHISFI